jgi:hypothetical protein
MSFSFKHALLYSSSLILYYNRITKAKKKETSLIMQINVHRVLYESVVAYILYRSMCLRAREDRTCFFKRLSVLFPLMMKVAHVDQHLE